MPSRWPPSFWTCHRPSCSMPPATNTKFDGVLQAEGVGPPSGAPALHRADRGIIGHVGPTAPYRSHILRFFAVFGGYHGLGRSAGEGVERQAPSPGKIAVARCPTLRTPPAAPLTGGVSKLAPPRWADGVPGGPPLACARAWRSTQAAADGDSPLHPAVPARDPPRRPPARRARTHASSRQCGCAPGLGLRRNGWGA